jgi:hypothetical protein
MRRILNQLSATEKLLKLQASKTIDSQEKYGLRKSGETALAAFATLQPRKQSVSNKIADVEVKRQ